MSNRPRRTAATMLLLLSILTLTSAGAAAFYYGLKLLLDGSFVGLILAAPIILVGMTLLLSWLLFSEGAAQEPENKSSRAP